MTAPHQEKNACEAYNRAVVCVIAGLTIDEAEALSAAIIHEKKQLGTKCARHHRNRQGTKYCPHARRWPQQCLATAKKEKEEKEEEK